MKFVKKDVIMFVSIFCVLALISGGTFAYWSWQSGTTNSVIFNTSKGIAEYIIYDEGNSHFIGDFKPSSSYCTGGVHNTLSFSKKSEASDVGLTATINMTVNHLSSVVSSTSGSHVHYALVRGDSSVCSGNVIKQGTFNGVSRGTTIELTTEEITGATKTFTVWIWLDNSSPSNLSGQTVDVNIWSRIDMGDGDDFGKGDAAITPGGPSDKPTDTM